MDLSAILEQGVEIAFDAIDDLVIRGTYYSRGTAPVYDPDTDTITYTAQNAENVRILRTSAEEAESEASAVTTADYKFLIPTVDLGVIVPDETDTIDYAGVIYNVLRIKSVPGESLQIIYVRRK